MNILFLSELLYPHGGGAELATYLYAKLLSEKDSRIAVVTNRFDGESAVSRIGNLVIYRLPLFEKTSSFKYSTLFQSGVLFSGLIRKLMKWADLVYVPRFWYLAIILAKAYKKPVATHLHDYIPICPLSNFYSASERTVCRLKNGKCRPSCIYSYEKGMQRPLGEVISSVFLNSTLGRCYSEIVGLSDLIICVSKAQRDLIIASKPGFRPKVCVVYNPLPEASHTSMIGDDFGYFGGPNLMKGFQILCLAANHVKRVKHKPLRIHATKFPNSADGNLERKLAQLGVFAYGKLDQSRYDDLNNHIGVVVVPSVWAEPLPYVVTEAAIKGKVIIASRIGGIPEQIDECGGAYLCDAGDYEQLADRMLYVEGLSKETLRALGMKNREHVIKRFDNEKIIGDFTRILHSVPSDQ